MITLFVYIVYDIKYLLKISIDYIIHFILFSKKMSLLTGLYGHVSHHILHEEEKSRRRNTALEYYPKEEKFLLYCPFYVKHLEEYTKTPWPRGLRSESATEYKAWGFLFYQA